MNTSTQKRGTLIAAGFLLSMAGLGYAAPLLDVAYDFGTDPGKTTYAAAGFAHVVETGTPTPTATNIADAVQLATTTSRLESGIERTFSHLDNSLTNNFTITTTFTLDVLAANSNNERPWGIYMYGNGNNLTTGISARFETRSNNPDRIQIFRGQTATQIASANLNAGTLGSSEISQGQTWTFTMVGTFNGLNLDFDLTIGNGTGTQLLEGSVLQSSLTGDYFGISGDTSNITASVDTFSVTVIPEPSTLALLGIALGSVFFFRRRR